MPSNAAQGRPEAAEAELRGHKEGVAGVAWNPAGEADLASCSSDGTVRLWDARAPGKCTATVALGGKGPVYSLCWRSDGVTVAANTQVNDFEHVVFVDARKGKVVGKRRFAGDVNELAWLPSGRVLLATTDKGTVEAIEYPSLEVVTSLKAHNTTCYCLAVSPDERRVMLSLIHI